MYSRSVWLRRGFSDCGEPNMLLATETIPLENSEDQDRFNIAVVGGADQFQLQLFHLSLGADPHKSEHTGSRSRSLQLETIFWRASLLNWPVGTAIFHSEQQPTNSRTAGECHKQFGDSLRVGLWSLAASFAFLTNGKRWRSLQAKGSWEAIKLLGIGPRVKKSSSVWLHEAKCQNHSIHQNWGNIVKRFKSLPRWAIQWKNKPRCKLRSNSTALKWRLEKARSQTEVFGGPNG